MNDVFCWRYVLAFLVRLFLTGHVLRRLGPIVIHLFAVAHADRVIV